MLNYHLERFRKLMSRRLALLSDEGLSKSLTVVIQPLSTRLIRPNICYLGNNMLT